MAARIRKDDIVMVISGDHKGATGKVLRVDPERDRVVVEGVNMVTRHLRKSQRHPKGARVQREAALPMCKVMPIDPKTGKGTRVRFKIERDGRGHVISKQRVSTAGTVLSEVTREKPKTGGA
ncbi:MAG: 50S ribosomal protein L24 [Planctomycetes bacterium]|nr:50S ribosomal protein L24 [Planctomycetota bacterium]